MIRISKTVGAVALIAVSAATALAQQNHQHDMPKAGTGQGRALTQADSRQFVQFPAPMVEHTLANMRDHLAALQEIQDHLGMGHPDVAARIAEERLGMSSLGLHGAHDAAKFMPQGMQDAGTGMHRAASRFAIVARDAGVTGDMKPVFTALAAVTAQCVGCHAGYRIK